MYLHAHKCMCLEIVQYVLVVVLVSWAAKLPLLKWKVG